MSNELQGKKIAFLAADGVEKVEFRTARAALEEAGAKVEVLSLKDGEIQARNHDPSPPGPSPSIGKCPRRRWASSTAWCSRAAR